MTLAFKLAPMPRANEFVSSDGSLTPAALNYLGNIEKLFSILTGLNGGDEAFISSATQAPNVASVNIPVVSATYTRAGTDYVTAEITTALDQLIGLVATLSSNDQTLEAAQNALISSLIASALMGA